MTIAAKSPAFPSDVGAEHTGIDTRTYLIAHAPPKPDWFMPPGSGMQTVGPYAQWAISWADAVISLSRK